VQTPGDLVGSVAELAARVELGEDDFDGGFALRLHDVDGDTATVVRHRRRSVGVEADLDGVGLAGQRLVDGVVDDLGEQLVVAVDPGAALHVHGRTLADALQAPEDLDVVCCVCAQVNLLGDPERRRPNRFILPFHSRLGQTVFAVQDGAIVQVGVSCPAVGPAAYA